MNLNNKIHFPQLMRENELIDETVNNYNELLEELLKTKNPLVCEAIQNQIDEIRSALDTIGIWNLLH